MEKTKQKTNKNWANTGRKHQAKTEQKTRAKNQPKIDENRTTKTSKSGQKSGKAGQTRANRAWFQIGMYPSGFAVPKSSFFQDFFKETQAIDRF